MTDLGVFLIWSMKDSYKRLVHQSQPFRLIGTFMIATAHFLSKGLFKFVSRYWLRCYIAEMLVFGESAFRRD